jgi:hypothetical protein
MGVTKQTERDPRKTETQAGVTGRVCVAPKLSIVHLTEAWAGSWAGYMHQGSKKGRCRCRCRRKRRMSECGSEGPAPSATTRTCWAFGHLARSALLGAARTCARAAKRSGTASKRISPVDDGEYKGRGASGQVGSVKNSPEGEDRVM